MTQALPQNLQEPAAPFLVEDDTSIRGKLTPMMQQYWDVKKQHMTHMVFYRMGDFYELFFDDAVKASKALNIALTKRGKIDGRDIPMCGVPVHAYSTYLTKLLQAGFYVAICEQTETPAQAKARGGYKALVKREVTRVVTPGTITEDNLLDAKRNNYLASLTYHRGSWGLAWADLSTGELSVQTIEAEELGAAMARLNPSEVLIPQNKEIEVLNATDLTPDHITPQPETRFNENSAKKQLMNLFNVKTLDAFGDFNTADLTALGALIDYIDLTQKGQMPHLTRPNKITENTLMAIDGATRRNLELNVTLNGSYDGSLLSIIDRTVTGAGARLLSTRLNAPLTNDRQINQRLDDVTWFYSQPQKRSATRDALSSYPDLERALSRLSVGRGGPRDLAAICNGLRQAKEIEAKLKAQQTPEITDLQIPEGITQSLTHLDVETNHAEIINTLDQALQDELPLLARDGNFIATGYSATLDEFVGLRDDSKRIIASLQADYIKVTGINTLKIKHNNILGYFVDVTATHADKLSEHEQFIHRQTLASAVRFTTVELSDLDKKISEAQAKALATELQIFDDLTNQIVASGNEITATARALAELDCASSLAELATSQNYARPIIDDSLTFTIKGGRHPVVEHALSKSGTSAFIPNDCDLNMGQSLWLLTGPNMAGKSTFLRQNALITLMAQMGSYVPATSAHIGVVDRLFSRVGAADDLARGQSTFMVEMVETATILNQATDRSLVILDEIGRGTATFDGLSIAWGTIEHLHDMNKSRGLFATHYHELTTLEDRLDNLACHTMRTKEWQNDIVFLHEVERGTANKSYGIHVARLAGLPSTVIKRAENILQKIETGETANNLSQVTADLPLFSTIKEEIKTDPRAEKLLKKLDNIDPDSLTPRDALDLLYELRKL